jgi:hypothetical protein
MRHHRNRWGFMMGASFERRNCPSVKRPRPFTAGLQVWPSQYYYWYIWERPYALPRVQRRASLVTLQQGAFAEFLSRGCEIAQ